MRRWGTDIAQINEEHLFFFSTFWFFLPNALPLPPPLLSLAVSYSLPFQTCLLLLIYLSPFKDGQSVTAKRSRGSEEEGVHYAKQGLGRQRRLAEMRCQHCTGALMYECGEIKRVTRQTGGGWKGESSAPGECSCTSASRWFLPSLHIPPSV